MFELVCVFELEMLELEMFELEMLELEKLEYKWKHVFFSAGIYYITK